MTNGQDKTDQLLEQLQALLEKQHQFSKEIEDLRSAIYRLKAAGEEQGAGKSMPEPGSLPEHTGALERVETTAQPGPQAPQDLLAQTGPQPQQGSQPQQNPQGPQAGQAASQPDQQVSGRAVQAAAPARRPAKTKSDLEQFIGENLINKIGIVITVIGVAIGAKYAIDHQLVSPLTRIVLGYLAGGILLAFAIRLKPRYENFSAVLLSGSMAILYFITYSAYSFYELIPQLLTFLLMVIFTLFTVAAAIHYNRQVIALIGMVGAYAVPFLLSDGSGRASMLFGYIAIINIGILFIAFRRYWRALYYTSFGFTWAIYAVWWLLDYTPATQSGLALFFLIAFFVIFYLAFLGYKLIRKEKFGIADIMLLLANSFVFFGFGYAIINDHETGRHLLGLFTLSNAIVHFCASLAIYRRKLADRNLFYFVSGLVLVFLTIAIPVQLDGNWVTLLWAGEAALLYWIGRSKNISAYEKLSYPLMLLAFFSIIHDWIIVYDSYYAPGERPIPLPLFNVHFLSSLLFIAAFGFIVFIQWRNRGSAASVAKTTISRISSFMIPAILLIAVYYAFRLEISAYWKQLYADSQLSIIPEGQHYTDYQYNEDLPRFKAVWILNYSLLFVSVLSFVNSIKLKSRQLGSAGFVLTLLALLAFLTQGLYVLSELRESYLEQELAEYYQRGFLHIGLRYISFAFVALALVACYNYVRRGLFKRDLGVPFELLVHIIVIWILSSEVINWLDISGSAQLYKFGLSILWGSYSLFMIILGIWKRRQYLRIGAILLFAITLVKLFFYDISHLNALSRTVLFVLLGALLLIISFLYNKYKHLIFDERDK